MAIIKGALFLTLVAGIASMWFGRQAVVEPYVDTTPTPVDIRLTGLELGYEMNSAGPSPFAVPPAPDTRTEEIVLAYEDDEAEAAPPPTIQGGTGLLRGVVSGPDGPVPFATVRIERHTVDGSISADVITDGRGRWSYSRVLGGRFRVRAWHPDEFASAGAEVFFLAEHETKSLDLPVEPFDDALTMTFADAGDIYVGLTGTVAVSVTMQAIDSDGHLTVNGLPGAIVTLQPSSGVVVAPATVTADSDGVARFQVRCTRAGSVTAIARHQNDEVFFVMPDCVPQPSPEPPPTVPTTQVTTPDPAVPINGSTPGTQVSTNSGRARTGQTRG